MGKLVADLAIETGMEVSLVERIVRSAPVRYKTYPIPKRNNGFRIISQPAIEVKALQRGLIEILLCKLPVHEAATAYRPGISIKDNASRHAGDGPILKMDFKDFFPSIKKRDWLAYCEETGALVDLEDIQLASSLMFQKPHDSSVLRLAIGAPSSPFLSNALMWNFDQAVSAEVGKDHVTYTRYADDLTFSAARTGHLVNVEKIVRSTLRALKYPKLTVNVEKTTRVTRKYGRKVTGLTLTNDGKISIGRERKRLIHAAVHHASQGKLDECALGELKGILGFVNSAEPSFMDTLRARYGATLIRSIQAFDIPKRKR
tara:strand:- start:542 stop:1489 length:948 start_codon:yes stop_codon:yes gene_type:complete